MSKCVVFGGNGFLGSHLVDMLVDDGHEVSVFDRFSDGSTNYTASNVEKFRGDFRNGEQVFEALKGQELLFHFLSATTPAASDKNPILDVTENIARTVNLLEMAVAVGVRRVVFASTGGAIYGSNRQTFFSETDQALPVSPYAIGKLSIENYLRYFKTTHGLDYLALRISNPYGSRQNPKSTQGLIPVVLRKVLAGLPLTRFGDGTMVRDYIHVADLMRMIQMILSAEPMHSTYNMGSGVGNSINEVLAVIRTVTGVEPVIIEANSPRSFVHRAVLDTTRFTTDFGAPALISLSDGIEKTWNSLSGLEAANKPRTIVSYRV